MKLDKIIVVNWGALRSEEYAMGNMTLLTGPTGAGKSTLLDALQTVMTAAHHNLFSYNPGQEETHQRSRDGKTKRTLWAYIVGAEDNLYSRPEGAHGYIAAVFKPDEGEQGAPFTALLGAAARVEGAGDRRVAVQERLALLLVDDAALRLEDLRDLNAEGAYQIFPVEKIESQLRARYPQVTSFRDSKREYLCQLYGRFRGKKSVSFQEAELAAKAWSQAIASKPIGSVDDLVKLQILEHDPQQLAQRISQISDLMRQMHGLRVEGERLDANVSSLERLSASIQRSTSGHESAVQYQVLASLLSLRQDELLIAQELNAARVLELRIAEEDAQVSAARQERKTAVTSQIQLEARLLGIPAVNEEQRIRENLAAAQARAEKAAATLAGALAAADTLHAVATQVIGMSIPPELEDLTKSASRVAQVLSEMGDVPLASCLAQAQDAALAVTARDGLSLARDLAPLNGRFDSLHQALVGTQDSVAAALQHQMATLKGLIAAAADAESNLATRKAGMADGKADYPNETGYALRVLNAELPAARVQVLCDLVDPVATEWQPAIESYMSKARFNLIVDEDWESQAVELVRVRNLPVKVVQGSYCLKHAHPERVPTKSIIHELHTEHPIAQAYLVEQFGAVVKVDTLEELRHTPRGLMLDGKASGSRTLFAGSTTDLVFGKEAKRLARLKVVEAHRLAEQHLGALRQQAHDLRMELSLVGTVQLPAFAAVPELDAAARDIEAAESALARLDLSEVADLLAEKEALAALLDALDDQLTQALTRVGQHTEARAEHIKGADALTAGLVEKQRRAEADHTQLRTLCEANDAVSYTTLDDEVSALLDTGTLSTAQVQEAIRKFSDRARDAHGDVRESVASYNQAARPDEQLSFVHGEQSRADFSPLYGALVALRKQVKMQLDAQREIGLRQNLDKLRRAEASFKDVFTKQFCYEIRNAVDSGVKTLRSLNTELERLKFGTDKFRIDWSAWVPEFKEYYNFFSAAYDLSEAQESGDLFSAAALSPENAKIRDRLTALLLSNDQERALKELQRIADYRNYRRYEIWKESDTGAKVALSEWGTGSGGQLETPAYIVQAAVVTNRLKHFEKGTNLKLLVNDESFARMDERRAHDVIRFIRDSLGIQLICAMPTKHAGALKSEFTKEWCFTRTAAEGNGEVDFISEADDRDLNPDKLRELWDARRRQVRLQAQMAFDEAEALPA